MILCFPLHILIICFGIIWFFNPPLDAFIIKSISSRFSESISIFEILHLLPDGFQRLCIMIYTTHGSIQSWIRFQTASDVSNTSKIDFHGCNRKVRSQTHEIKPSVLARCKTQHYCKSLPKIDDNGWDQTLSKLGHLSDILYHLFV